jgi:hypothetical protein
METCFMRGSKQTHNRPFLQTGRIILRNAAREEARRAAEGVRQLSAGGET